MAECYTSRPTFAACSFPLAMLRPSRVSRQPETAAALKGHLTERAVPVSRPVARSCFTLCRVSSLSLSLACRISALNSIHSAFTQARDTAKTCCPYSLLQPMFKARLALVLQIKRNVVIYSHCYTVAIQSSVGYPISYTVYIAYVYTYAHRKVEFESIQYLLCCRMRSDYSRLLHI